MNRRTFAIALSAMGLGVIGCRADGPGAVDPPTSPPPPPPPPPPTTGRAYETASDRAFGVADWLVRSAEPVAGGVRWRAVADGATVYPTDIYSGQAGVIAFLAEVYRVRPDPAMKEVLEQAGSWLRSQARSGSPGLYTGDAGRAWAYLSLHEALGGASSTWLSAAVELAPAIASPTNFVVGDMIAGTPGQGLLLLRLFRITGDPRWLAAARALGDALLTRAVRSGAGIKFPSGRLADGRTMFYPGMAHGTAGTGYFLSRLALALPAGQRGVYEQGAVSCAAWLDGLATARGAGVNWYRREPDEMNIEQVQWCHGAPGIGLFYAELHRLTAHPPHLDTATRAALFVDAERPHGSSCLCHGVAGNAQLFLKLYRQTGAPEWLGRAIQAADLVWSRRLQGTEYPAWRSGDSSGVNQPGLLTGTAGIGWFYLQLAQDGKLGGPIVD